MPIYKLFVKGAVQSRPVRWSFFSNDGMVILLFQGTIAIDVFQMVLSPPNHHHKCFFHSWTIGNDGLLMVFKILGMMVIDGKGQNCRFLDLWNSPTFQVILEKGQAETFQGFLGSHNKYPGWNRSESENREFFNWRHAKSYWRWRANFWSHRKVSMVLGEPWPKMTHSIKMTKMT